MLLQIFIRKEGNSIEIFFCFSKIKVSFFYSKFIILVNFEGKEIKIN